jgi:hypothetical protein
MNRGLVGIILVGTAMAALSAPVGVSSAASLKFKSCAQMNERFPTGLAQSARAASRAQAAEYERPQVNASLFRQVRQSNPRLRTIPSGVLCPVRAVPQPPGAVTGLRIQSVAREALTLEWRPPVSDGGVRVSAYLITGTGSISVTGTRATVSSLLPGTRYEYEVAAVNSAGVGPSVTVSVETLPPPIKFEVPPLWKVVEYSWAPPGSTYLNYDGSEGTVLSLGNAPQLLGRVSGTLCSGAWYDSASARIEFLDGNGSPVSRNAVVNGRPDLTKPDPYSYFGPSQELVGYFPSTGDLNSYGCGSESIDLAAWQRAKQIRVVSVNGTNYGQVLLGLSARDQQ